MYNGAYTVLRRRGPAYLLSQFNAIPHLPSERLRTYR